MSFDTRLQNRSALLLVSLNPFRAVRCLSTGNECVINSTCRVLIPFEQCDVFRHDSHGMCTVVVIVLIPFEQCDVFRRWCYHCCYWFCFVLIPFEQCDVFRLTLGEDLVALFVLIPFEQCDVFRH